MGTVTAAGFYGGEFKKAGQFHDGETETASEAPDFERMSKDELAAEAKLRGIEVKAGDTKADIIEKLKA